MKHVWNFIKWFADILFSICVIVSFILMLSMGFILMLSVLFFPNDNVVLAAAKWLATKQF